MRASTRRIVGVGLGLLFMTQFAVAGNEKTVVGGVVISVSDLDKSVAYYRMLGLQKGEDSTANYTGISSDGFVHLVIFNVDRHNNKFTGGIVLEKKVEGDAPIDMGTGLVHIFFVVPDVRAVCKRLKEAHMSCTEPKVIAEDGNALLSYAKDPDGYDLELVQPAG